MATQKVEIELNVKSNAGQAAKDMGALADNTRKAGQAAKATNDSFARDAMHEASVNQWKAQQAARKAGGLPGGWDIDPTFAMPGRGPTAAGGGANGPGMFGRLAPWLGAAGVAHTLGAAGSYLDANRNNPAALTMGGMLNHAMGSLPLVGGAWRFADAAVGGQLGFSETAWKNEAGQRIGEINRFSQNFAQEQALEQSSRMQQIGIEGQRRQLRSDQRGAAIAERLYYDRGQTGQYVTEDRLGESTSQTGALRFARLQAEGESAAGKIAVQEAEKAQSEQQQRVKAAEQALTDAQKNFMAAKTENYEALHGYRGVDKKRFGEVDVNEERDQRAANAAAGLANAGKTVEEKEAALAAERLRLQERIKQTMEAQGQAAQKNYALAQSELAVIKDQVSVAQQKKNVLQSAAEQSLFEDEATKQDRMLAIQKFQTQGPQSLNPDEVALVRGYAPAGQMVRDAAKESARNDPTFNQINQLLGLGTLDQAEADAKKLAEEFNRKQLEANAAYRTEITKTLSPLFDDLVKAIRDGTADAIRQARTKNENERRDSQYTAPAGT